jgi:cold shock CspA family protein
VIDTDDIIELNGRIKSFFKDKGYGFIVSGTGTYFFHVSQLLSTVTPVRGSTVRFKYRKSKAIAFDIEIVFSKNAKVIALGTKRMFIKNVKAYGTDVREFYFEKIYQVKKGFWTTSIAFEAFSQWEEPDEGRIANVTSKENQTFKRYRDEEGELKESDFETDNETIELRQICCLYVIDENGQEHVFREDKAGFNIYQKLEELDIVFGLK